MLSHVIKVVIGPELVRQQPGLISGELTLPNLPIELIDELVNVLMRVSAADAVKGAQQDICPSESHARRQLQAGLNETDCRSLD